METEKLQSPDAESTLKVKQLSENIKAHKEQIYDLLTHYESFTTAEQEVWLAIDCLENIGLEKEHLAGDKVGQTAVFLPLNLPLYSLITFCVVPSLMSENLTFRPPKMLTSLFEELTRQLELTKLFDSVKMTSQSRNSFVKDVAARSDVVIFTGQYENAIEIKDKCPSSLFVYSGSPIDPILLYENADLDLAVEKTVAARTFNSGQDCAGPDAILVPEKTSDQFLEKLISKLRTTEIGDYKNRKVQIGKLISSDALKVATKKIAEQQDRIVYGGKVDTRQGIVYPTVVVANLNDYANYSELFCPIFNILTYKNKEDLQHYFDDDRYKDNAMYACIFGDSDQEVDIPNSVILRGLTLLDFAAGNYPYGGFGYKANFISYKDKLVARPILISKEIRSWKDNGVIQE